MAFKKKSAEESTNALTGFLPENQLRVAFQPQFAASLPIEADADGIPIKGTALVIYQGIKHSSIDWNQDGVDKSVAKLAFVFAIKGVDGSFKNFPKKASYGWIVGNDLDKLINKLGGKVVLENLSQSDNELFGDDFGSITRLDLAGTWNSLEILRGKAYTAVVEKKLSKNNRYYHDLEISTITPRLNKDGEHIQAQKPADTDPNALLIDWNE